jgi:hypothetical protein
VRYVVVFELGAVLLGALVPTGALKGGVEAVAAVVDRPDREPVGYRPGLGWQRLLVAHEHMIAIGAGSASG